MRHPRVLAALACACAAGLACTGRDEGGARRANVVVVVVDTLRADFADPAGTRAELPSLRAFAADAVAFRSAFSPAPMTLPAHAALFSSRSPYAAGVTTNGQALARDVPLLSDWLRSRGWSAQAAVSLATLWPLSRGQGLDRGFERFARGSHSISAAGDTNRELATIVDALAGEPPFFLFAHYAEPHEPYEAPGQDLATARIEWNGAELATATISEWAQLEHEVELAPGENRLAIRSTSDFKLRDLTLDAPPAPPPSLAHTLTPRFETGALLAQQQSLVAVFDNPRATPERARLRLWLHDVPPLPDLPARYRIEAEAADRAFGALLEMLRQRGLYEDSLIVFTSDHGEALGEHDVVGHVVNLHDEMLHVPLLVKLPRGHAGHARLARSARSLARLIDVAPTILEALDLPPLPGQEGVSLFEDHERVLLAQTFRPEAPRTLFALRDERTKLVYDVEADAFRMYDLVADPGELVDIFAKAGAQKPTWQSSLRALRDHVPALEAEGGSLDPTVRRRLESLGY